MIQRCPEPRNWRCKCPVHQELGAQDFSGRWHGLKDVPYEGEFELRL